MTRHWWRNVLDAVKRQRRPQGVISPSLALARLGYGYRRRNASDLVRAYTEVPWLRAVVHRIATAVASVPYEVLVGERPAPAEHPARQLLDRGAGGLTGWNIRVLTQVYLDLVGEAWWVLGRDSNGQPVEAWPVPPHWVSDVKDDAVVVSAAAATATFPRRDVVWFRDPDPSHPYGRGAGTAGAMVDEIAADEYAAQFLARFFSNAARPDILVSVQGVSPEQLQRIQAEWESRAQGLHNAFRAHFINAPADVRVLEQNLAHLQFVELRRFERDLLAQVFGVPPEILGIVEHSNRATIQAANDIFGRWVIRPRLALWQSVLNTHLAAQYTERVTFVWQDAVPRDLEFALRQSTEGLRSGAVTINEWRERNGFPPIADGDQLLTPVNVAPERVEVDREAVRALFDVARRKLSQTEDYRAALRIVQWLQRQVLEVLQ